MVTQPERIKALGLISGGLDSALAARMMVDQGVDVCGLFFVMPWVEKEPAGVEAMARQMGIDFRAVQLGDDYLALLQQPCYGYGRAFNPCIDCHMFMIKKAGGLMRELGADFVFTGEVLGQRPMSQRKACLELIERGTDLEGLLLRPLSALLLPETVPENKGWVDRGRLLGLSGRSRRDQLDLAEAWGVSGFSAPAGGCLITDVRWGRRMKDFLQFGCRDYRAAAILKWGRYFRLGPDHVALLGRDEREDEQLIRHADAQDLVMEFFDLPGPALVLKVRKNDDKVLAVAAGLVQRYSKFKAEAPMDVWCYSAGQRTQGCPVRAVKLEESEIQSMVP